MISSIFIRLGFISVLVLSIASCGGSGETASSNTGIGTGTVGILLTDKPADPSLFTSINATINRVELLGSDDDGKVVLYDGIDKTVDLLRLKNESIPFTFRDDVPTGEYCKIRLILSELELVLTDGSKDYPKLPGNGKLDLVVRDCFTVEANKAVTLQIDIDGTNSIHITSNAKGFNFRPVIFVDVLDGEFIAKLIRLEGEITRVDTVNNTLILCNALPMYNSGDDKCALITFDKDSAFFDNQAYAGDPRALSELVDENRIGEAVTVVGRAQSFVSYDDECVDHHDEDDDGKEEDEDKEECEYHHLLSVEAIAVEAGDFLQLEGNVATNSDGKGFGMNVTNGPIVLSEELPVALQAGSAGINGTRIVTKTGELIDHTQIIVPREVAVDGVFDATAKILKSALVIVDISDADSTQITGSVLSVTGNELILSPDTTACGIAGDLSVTVEEGAVITTVTITETGSEIMPGGSIAADQTIGLNGSCDTATTGSFKASSAVIVNDTRP